MKITKVILVAASEQFEKALTETLTIKGRKLKGHVMTDLYRVVNEELHLDRKDVLIEAAHALENNKQKNVTKIYLSAGTKLEAPAANDEKENELDEREKALVEREDKLKKLNTDIGKREKAVASAEETLREKDEELEKKDKDLSKREKALEKKEQAQA